MEPYGFSADLNAYLKKVLEEDNDREDRSGKWLESVTGGARRYDYWSKIIKGARSMTTNDVQVIASTFGISPFEWVANARRHASGERTMALRPNVGPHPEDYDISEDPGDELPSAAERPREPK